MAEHARMFSDVRVRDFTHDLAGPFCTLQLALQGADVIKVEPIGDDPSRSGSRDRTGEGPFVDVAMLDSMPAFLSYHLVEYTVTRKPTAARFRCREGFLVLAVLTAPRFERLMRAIGRADALAADDAERRMSTWT